MARVTQSRMWRTQVEFRMHPEFDGYSLGFVPSPPVGVRRMDDQLTYGGLARGHQGILPFRDEGMAKIPAPLLEAVPRLLELSLMDIESMGKASDRFCLHIGADWMIMRFDNPADADKASEILGDLWDKLLRMPALDLA